MADPKIITETKKGTEVPTKENETDVYLAFLDTSPMVSIEDIAVYKQGEGKILIPVDARGRPITNYTFYFRKEVWDKMTKKE